MGRYVAWLNSENTRTGAPNWVGQVALGAVAILASLIFVPAMVALAVGTPWSSEIQSASVHGRAVYRPVGVLGTTGGMLVIVGVALVVSALQFKRRAS